MFFKSQEKFSGARILGWTGFGWDFAALVLLSCFLGWSLIAASGMELLVVASMILIVTIAFRFAGRQAREHVFDHLEDLPAFFENAMARKAYTHSPRHRGDERRLLTEDAIALGARLVERREALRWQMRERIAISRGVGVLFALLAAAFAYAGPWSLLHANVTGEALAAAAASTCFALYGGHSAIDLIAHVPRSMNAALQRYNEVNDREIMADYFEQEGSDQHMADRAVLAISDRLLSGASQAAMNALDALRRDRINRQLAAETDPRWTIRPPAFERRD